MRLSATYSSVSLWALVYHTQPGSEVVELVTPRFFQSEERAWDWFKKRHKRKDFVEPEAVRVGGLASLSFER